MTKDYTGCKVVLRDAKTDRIMLESLILECDTKQFTITVAVANVDLIGLNTCSVLIFGSGTLYEYNANVRGAIIGGEVVLALHHGGEKPDLRGAKRHVVDKDAYVLRNRQTTPLPIRVVDISTAGAQLEGSVTALYETDLCRLCLEIGGQEVFLDTRVLRKEVTQSGVARYGCAFLAVEEGPLPTL